MAEDWKKRRRREEEEEEAGQKAIDSGNLTQLDPETAAKLEEKIDDLFFKANSLIDRCNSLFQMYMTGVEQRPPREVRQQIDTIMSTLTMMAKPTQVQKFKFYTLQSKYHTHKERWDKLQKDIEEGRIKRITGPRRAG